MLLRNLALLSWCVVAFVPRRPQRPALSCAAKKPQPPATRELESLKVGERVSGPLVGKVFQGKRGVKAFLDVGCVGNNKKRINGMLRLPHYKQWRNGTDAYKRLTKELRDARRGKSVTAYVAAVHAASQQLVLEPFAKPRPPSLKLLQAARKVPSYGQRRVDGVGALDVCRPRRSELEIGTELRNCRVVGMTAKFAYVDTPCFHDGARATKPKRRLRARLVLPPTIALETAPVKAASIEKVLRLDDLVTCYVRRPEPASGRLEVGIEPASLETLASEAKARDGRRQARARRAAVTKRLEVGQRFRGVVLRRLAYGVSVDIGATGPGLVLRGDRDRDFVGVGDRVSVEVAAVEPRDAGPPRLTLELVEEEEVEDIPAPPQPAAPRTARPEPEPEPTSMFDDLDDLDDIEASLGLDEY